MYCQVIGDLIKQSAILTGEPIKSTGKPPARTWNYTGCDPRSDRRLGWRAVRSAVRTDRRADQAIGKINRRADQGTGENGHLAKHWAPIDSPLNRHGLVAGAGPANCLLPALESLGLRAAVCSRATAGSRVLSGSS